MGFTVSKKGKSVFFKDVDPECQWTEHQRIYMKQKLKSMILFLRQSFSAVLESILELAFVDQVGLKLTDILLPLPPEYWLRLKASITTTQRI